MECERKTVCKTDMCTGCMACADSCPKHAIRLVEGLWSYNAVIDDSLCVKCGKCFQVCQKNHPVSGTTPVLQAQGWRTNPDDRKKSASGGAATAIAEAFIAKGGTVCACKQDRGEFGFHVFNTLEDFADATGSKYVKSNPTGIYKKVDHLLRDGNPVLFIGLPCQVAALNNYLGNTPKEQLYTADLVCHGTPAPELLKQYLKQYHLSLETMEKMVFRHKEGYKLYSGIQPIVKAIRDCYTTAFLKGISLTENCYHCDYARIERVSDLTLGDAWGSDFPKEERSKGISLVLCQSEKGKKLVEMSDLQLYPVNMEKMIHANRQLSSPALRPSNRQKLMKYVDKGYPFNLAMLLTEPKIEIKNIIKVILARLNLYRGYV